MMNLSGKAEPSAPQITKDNVELSGIPSAGSDVKLPLHDDIMQLARMGEVQSVEKLFDEGKVDIAFKDEEGITPLHVGRML
jgi:palmitoyltransferase